MSTRPTIGVLVPTDGTAPTVPPSERPIGRAAMMLSKEGTDVVFGDTITDGCISGYRVNGDTWEAVKNIPIVGVHDRYPSQIRADQYNKIQAGLGEVPMGNALAFTMLCRDKIASQEALQAMGIRMPELVKDPTQFNEALARWGSAFLKPQYGALGIGVQRVVPGDHLPVHISGVVPQRPDPSILQAAIPPPKGWASQTVRVLIQRSPEGGWFSGTPVVRRSPTDPVANAARGAEVAPGPVVLSKQTIQRIQHEVHTICAALDGMHEAKGMVEAGVDLVLDQAYEPWLIEINSRPRGRMEVLADTDPKTYLSAHVQACARPLKVIAKWAKAED